MGANYFYKCEVVIPTFLVNLSERLNFVLPPNRKKSSI